VDVLFRINVDETVKKFRKRPSTIITDVEVLATGTNTLPGKANLGQPASVTLAVTPDQANSSRWSKAAANFR